jgi:hypothetical protein
MALSSASVVHVDKPAELLLSEYFAEMRIWLDAHEITPTAFRLFGGPIVGLEVRFRSPEQAALFEQEFVPKRTTNVVPLIFADLSARHASEALSSHDPADCARDPKLPAPIAKPVRQGKAPNFAS